MTPRLELETCFCCMVHALKVSLSVIDMALHLLAAPSIILLFIFMYLHLVAKLV